MKERGTAIKIQGTDVTVRITLSEGCASCHSKDGCRMENRDIQAVAATGMQIHEGDVLDIHVPDSAITAGLFWLIMVPVGLFVGAYLAAGQAGANEGWQALAGMVGLGCGLLIAVAVARKTSMGRRPTVLGRVVGAEPVAMVEPGA
jgi:sigma-E factor negative regulatory protein RseC